jgi:Stress responsive A/B Barrel Domain
LYSEFTDRSALIGYQSHPVHEAVKSAIRELTTERRVVDYDC